MDALTTGASFGRRTVRSILGEATQLQSEQREVEGVQQQEQQLHVAQRSLEANQR